MKSIKLSKKTYLTAFIFVMLLNICLGFFLIRNVLAQKTETTFKDQPPIVAEVVKQEDSPLQITILNVDNPADSHQIVNYVTQNLSQKQIRTYVLLYGDDSGSGGTTINILKLLRQEKPFNLQFLKKELT